MTTPSVSIVIPTLDAGDMLLGCLSSLGADDPELEVILVDNASTDGSVARAQERFPNVRVVRNDTNRGYAPACNQGADVAAAPFVLFLNNDASIGASDVDGLLDAARADHGTAIWQPVTYGLDGALESTGDTFTWWGINRHLEQVPDGSSVEVFATVGAALLVRRQVFEELGGFESSYFAYYEESDLCWRARMLGWDVRVVTDARVTHIGSETTGQIFEPQAVRYLSFRNRIRTNLANPSASSMARLLPQHALACLGFVALYLATGRWRSAGAVLQAMWWPVGNRDVVREQRVRVQAMRRRSDRELFRPGLVSRFGPRAIWRHLRRQYWFEDAAARKPVSDSTRQS
jgi:hypothetical protein